MAVSTTHFEDDFIITLDLSSDAEITKDWSNKIFNLWRLCEIFGGKKNTLFSVCVHDYLSGCSNPYVGMVKLLHYTPLLHEPKAKSPACAIVEEFKTWLHEVSCDEDMLDVETKLNAYRVVAPQGHVNLVEMIAEAFKFATNRDEFMGFVLHLVTNKMYKEACYLANILDLHDNFSVEEFLFPLVLQDKVNVVDGFLKKNKSHQFSLVSYLDKLLNKNVRLSEAIDSILCRLDVPQVKNCYFQPKALQKLVLRLVKTYDLPPDIYPNVMQRRGEGTLQFLAHKRFIGKTLGEDSFREMVKETISSDTNLQQELLVILTQYGETQEAIDWAKYYNIGFHDWPKNLCRFYEEGSIGRFDDGQSSTAKSYYKLNLPASKVVLVDSVDSFSNMLSSQDLRCGIAGIDAEWKPLLHNVSSTTLSLVQIATENAVFILDALNLSLKVPHLWKELGRVFFNNGNILKLGYGLSSDIKQMNSALPHLPNIDRTHANFLDMCELVQALDTYKNFTLPHSCDKQVTGLSSLVMRCTGLPLDKSEQFSNWENRPLRPSQLEYAANDARCLLDCYETVGWCAAQQEIPLDAVRKEMFHESVKRKAKGKKKA